MAKLSKKRFILFKTAYNKAYIVEAELRPVTSNKSSNYGMYHIYTDMQYNPLTEDKSYKDYMSKKSAESLLLSKGFISVKDDFDKDKISDLREVKSKIPSKWIELYNLWSGFSG